MNKIKRSGRLPKASFAVLLREKKLLLFPLIASAMAVVVALFFIAPVAFYPTGHPYFSTAHWSALAICSCRILPRNIIPPASR